MQRRGERVVGIPNVVVLSQHIPNLGHGRLAATTDFFTDGSLQEMLEAEWQSCQNWYERRIVY
jgi:hypothetical protein